jgi:Na+-translocating ferredoxin:NAD+ oxidoreductase RnfD subunit
MFPFSMQQNASEKSGSFIKVLFSLIIPFILAFIHFFIFKSMIAIVVAIFCSLILNYMLLQRLRKRSWTVMASPYSI